MLVKRHDRVGRMADTLEYTDVAFPRARFDAGAGRRASAPGRRRCSRTTATRCGEASVHRTAHDAAEPVPRPGSAAQVEAVVLDYGKAIKELASANIFPGDMLFKNFGVTRGGRVVFYDYDEITYMTETNFRRIPPPPHARGRAVGGTLVSCRGQRRVPRGVRAVSAHRRQGPRGVPGVARRSAGAGVLERSEGAGRGRAGRGCVSLSRVGALRASLRMTTASAHRQGCHPSE